MRAHLTATAPNAPNLDAYEKFACCNDIFLSVSTYKIQVCFGTG